MEKWFVFGRDAAFDEGMRHVESGNCAEAAASFEVCLGRACEPAIRRLAEHHLCLALMSMAMTSLSCGNALEGVTLLLRAVQVHPEYADLRLRLAVAYAQAGDTESAVASCQEAIKINPSYSEAHRVLEVLALGNRIETPIRDSVEARIGAAKSAQRDRSFERAEAILNELILAHPTYADVRCLYSQVLLELDRLDEGITHLQVALRLNPRYADAWATLGVAWRRVNLIGEAEMAFNTALEINPKHPVASAEALRLKQL